MLTNQSFLILHGKQHDKTPLHYAVEKGDQFVIQALLDKGASVDCVDKVSDYITTCTFIIITG